MSIVEAVFSTVLVAVIVVAALGTVGASVSAQSRLTDHGQGQMLALDLMAEIMEQAFSEPDEASVFGPEATEQTGSRAAFDDVDDYHNWQDDPPTYKNGTPIPGFDEWQRSVNVQWVSPNNLTQISLTNTGVVRITITVTHHGKTAAVLTAVRADRFPDPIIESQ